jgi:acetyltransferase-like isoleucine patch superfamily enzyme
MSENSIIHPNVQLGEGVTIGAFVIIGEPARGVAPGEVATIIGNKAVIRSHSVIYAGNEIGDGFQTGHNVMVREENEIGSDVSIGTHSIVEHHVYIGDGVRIHSQVFVPEFSRLEAGCWLGPNVVLTNARYPRSPKVKDELIGPIIHGGAKIGANSTLLPGVVIGRNVLVGAGSVVVRDVPDGAIVAGNPAKFIKWVKVLGVYPEEML